MPGLALSLGPFDYGFVVIDSPILHLLQASLLVDKYTNEVDHPFYQLHDASHSYLIFEYSNYWKVEGPSYDFEDSYFSTYLYLVATDKQVTVTSTPMLQYSGSIHLQNRKSFLIWDFSANMH